MSHCSLLKLNKKNDINKKTKIIYLIIFFVQKFELEFKFYQRCLKIKVKDYQNRMFRIHEFIKFLSDYIFFI